MEISFEFISFLLWTRAHSSLLYRKKKTHHSISPFLPLFDSILLWSVYRWAFSHLSFLPTLSGVSSLVPYISHRLHVFVQFILESEHVKWRSSWMKSASFGYSSSEILSFNSARSFSAHKRACVPFFTLKSLRGFAIKLFNSHLSRRSHTPSALCANFPLHAAIIVCCAAVGGGGDEIKLKLSFLNSIKSYAITSMNLARNTFNSIKTQRNIITFHVALLWHGWWWWRQLNEFITKQFRRVVGCCVSATSRRSFDAQFLAL